MLELVEEYSTFEEIDSNTENEVKLNGFRSKQHDGQFVASATY